jgi:hypothetical protein
VIAGGPFPDDFDIDAAYSGNGDVVADYGCKGGP